MTKQSLFFSAAIGTILAGAVYLFVPLVSEYGWEGALRYIWEGDAFPHHIRKYLDSLEDGEASLDAAGKTLTELEEGLERARLDSVDGSEASSILPLWEKNIFRMDLRKQLAKLSYDLDNIAANLDNIISEELGDVKIKKKKLSKQVVQYMERADCLIQFFEHAKAGGEGKKK